MEHFYKQPKYFGKFRCLGGECSYSCCDGWRITWEKDEYDKLKNAPCSETLKKRFETAFEQVSDTVYRINMVNSTDNSSDREEICDDKWICPFHNQETGLCDIQKELGESYLGKTCVVYPRQFLMKDRTVVRTCHLACPAVLDHLLNEESSTEMEIVKTSNLYKELEGYTAFLVGEKVIRDHPAFRYHTEILDFYNDLLGNKDRSIENSIILGALAAKKISDLETTGNAERLPSVLEMLKKQLNDPATVRSVDEIKPNYALKFKLAGNVIVKYLGARCEKYLDLSLLHDGQNILVDNYIKGMENFRETFSGREFAMRNVIVNTYWDIMNNPALKEGSFYDNYSYFVMCSAVYMTVAASVGFKNENIEFNFRRILSMMSRAISRDKKISQLVVDDIKNIGLTSPAHLALIIK